VRITRLGVIDLGSNSGRLILALRQVHGFPLIVDEAQATLRLAEGLQATNTIGRPAIERTRAALRGFQAAAAQFGVERLITVGTSALRDAVNGAEVVDELRCAGALEIEVLSGEREAYYGYLAAVNSLPLRNGVVIDLGGGSLEVSFVRDRACERAVSLPLGSLRMSERFLTGDPPAGGQIAALKALVAKRLNEAGLGRLKEGTLLVGGGGTVRTLAKLVRKALGAPSLRLHGYAIEAPRLKELTRTLGGQSVAQRRRMPGMPPERADIIAAGAVVVNTVLEVTGARSLLVCGQGLREGLAYEAFRVQKSPVVRDVRQAGVDAFRERYVTGALRQFTHEDATHPGETPVTHGHPSDGVEPLALRLLERLAPLMPVTAGDRALLSAAAALCDAGRAVSLYRWPEHAMYLLTNGDLNGYTQAEAVLIGQIVASQEGQRVDLEGYGLDLADGEAAQAGRLGFVVGMARWLRRFGVDAKTPLSVLTPPGSLIVVLPPGGALIADEWEEGLARGCRRYLDRELQLTRVGE
jgi:exopolyphosphatase/guanosine-5'-triphosphate,3'-diphosphate pyrophosphatase